MDVLLAVAGTLVVLLVSGGMVLVTPFGTRPADRPDDEAEALAREPELVAGES